MQHFMSDKTSDEIYRDMKAMEEYIVHREMKYLKETLYVLNTNYSDFMFHVESVNKREGLRKLNIVYRRNPTEKFQLETKRLLHNYLSSVISLIDHTRIYIKKLHSKKEFLEYESMINKTFIENPTCVFIKDFRQYLQHYRLPEVSLQINLMSIKLYNTSIIISKDNLRKFSGWKKLSTEYINNQINDINLRIVVQEYQAIVENFYSWLLGRQEEIFADEIQLISDIKTLIKEKSILEFIERLLVEDFKKFDEVEIEICQFFSDDELVFLERINNVEKVEKILILLNLKGYKKTIIKNKLENLLV